MITIRAFPNAKKFSITIREGGSIAVRLKAKAQDGEANRELEKQLSQITGTRAAIMRGHKSREKTIAFEKITEKEALEKIAAFAKNTARK